MADLIDRKALARVYMSKGKDKLRLATVINELELAPAVDAVEVVRCKDCANACDCGEPYLVCVAWGCPCDADEWCSRGERREENAD